jgi:hypothetical protein
MDRHLYESSAREASAKAIRADGYRSVRSFEEGISSLERPC